MKKHILLILLFVVGCATYGAKSEVVNGNFESTDVWYTYFTDYLEDEAYFIEDDSVFYTEQENGNSYGVIYNPATSSRVNIGQSIEIKDPNCVISFDLRAPIDYPYSLGYGKVIFFKDRKPIYTKVAYFGTEYTINEKIDEEVKLGISASGWLHQEFSLKEANELGAQVAKVSFGVVKVTTKDVEMHVDNVKMEC